MSKAFVRESDELLELPEARPLYSLFPGVTNYLTSQGLHGLEEKLSRLLVEPVSDTSRQQIFALRQCIQSAVVPETPPLPWNQIFFGATVTALNEQDEPVTYRLVGLNETDLDRNQISWRSPMARALLKAKVGDHVRFQTPDGEQCWKITHVSYEP